MEKAYQPELFESRLYENWMASGAFRAHEASSVAGTSPKPPFSIVLPPPNVTGVLHNGHALVVTIQDTLTRWKRMCGYDALWLPGTDHAGIATQMVVERDLAKQGLKRHALGRAEFLKRVWTWKEKHGEIITNQMKKLGASADWSRSKFTMDPDLSRAVRTAFVRLHQEGLIYRGTRIINWCVRCQTALSDLEVRPIERKSHLWHIRYSLEDPSATPGGAGEIVIATTRPETLLGDTAVAVHPDDERYQTWVGKRVKLPLVGRSIPVIADAYVDRTFGSGGLKVTPGHDFNDYDLGQKHQLKIISIFDKAGRVVSFEGGEQLRYIGMTVQEAREAVLQDLTASGALVRTEDHVNKVGVCDRCEHVVEPFVSDQWFMNVKPLAEKALAAVRKGESLSLKEVDARDDAIKIVPETWNTTFYNWMENIRDWCISRQLWWGHQIPAWHCAACGTISVNENDLLKCPKCGEGDKAKFVRDEDVLDTWFSSALWPFSTLGWPDSTAALQRFYPTSIMETGFDILFFWVARMAMMGMHFNGGRVPFKRVYLHAMVRDERGQKMSKTKGNVIDPLDIIAQYGADAFRFTLAAMAGQGRDVKLSLDRVDGYKAFCNKLWNASRFVLMRMGIVQPEGLAPLQRVDFAAMTQGMELGEWLGERCGDRAGRGGQLHPVNQWILSRLATTTEAMNAGFEEFRLHDAAQAFYQFVWGDYCDWYIEFTKEMLDGPAAAETQVCLFFVLENILRLGHPLIPFVTEEIYQNLPRARKELLVTAPYPQPKDMPITPITAASTASPPAPSATTAAAVAMVERWKEFIELIRAFRGENNIAPKARPHVFVLDRTDGLDQTIREDLERGFSSIRTVAQLESIEWSKLNQFSEAETQGMGEIHAPGVTVLIPLAGLVDTAAEVKRLQKERETVLADIQFVQTKLSKESFVSKAPAELIAKEREKLDDLQGKATQVERAIEKLKKMGQQT